MMLGDAFANTPKMIREININEVNNEYLLCVEIELIMPAISRKKQEKNG
jgi:hypothetical protein